MGKFIIKSAIFIELAIIILSVFFINSKYSEFLTILRFLEHGLLLCYYIYRTVNINKYILCLIVLTLFSRIYIADFESYKSVVDIILINRVLLFIYIYKYFELKKLTKYHVYIISVMLIIFTISLYLIFSFDTIDFTLANAGIITRIIFSEFILIILFYMSFVNVLENAKGRGNLELSICISICVFLNISFTFLINTQNFIFATIYTVLNSLAIWFLVVSNIKLENSLSKKL